MKRILAWLCACAMLCPMFGACSQNVSEDATLSGDLAAADPVSEEDMPDLPPAEEIGDISGDFHILVSGSWAWNDFESDGENGTVVDAAIYRRNAYMSDKYKVDITNEDIIAWGSSTGSGLGYSRIYTDYMAGDSHYDAAMIGTFDVATLAYNGYIHDLNDIPYIDLTKDYWDQRANEDLSMNGKMYYTTGEISLADNRSTDALFFNKRVVADYGLDNPYELVKHGEWTLEKFGEMVRSVGADENDDGVYDKNDTFGLLAPSDMNLAILAAANERVCTINDAGQMELTLYSERVVDLYDQYLDIVKDYAHTYFYQYNYLTGARGETSTTDERVSMFNTGHALFHSHTMFYMDYLRDLESDFGILPFPKLNREQTDYRTLVSPWHSMFLCVPEMSADLERTGIVLEELAYQGKKMLTPAYYEKTLVGQYTRDEESAEMLDIIFANLVYDVGLYYEIGTYRSTISSMVSSGMSLTTIYETYRTIATTKMDKINAFFNSIN